jgi:hypothetical protein
MEANKEEEEGEEEKEEGEEEGEEEEEDYSSTKTPTKFLIQVFVGNLLDNRRLAECDARNMQTGEERDGGGGGGVRVS